MVCLLTDAVEGVESGAALTLALLQRVRALNADPSVHGIIVQLPLPQHVDTQRVLAEIRQAGCA